MKATLSAVGVLVFLLSIYVCAEPNSVTTVHSDFEECLAELGMQDIDLYEISRKRAFPCLLACLQEKIGVMAGGKIQIGQYIQNYLEAQADNPGDYYLIRSKLIECATEANKLSDKCMVADSTRKCEADYRVVLFPS